jgi:hypothetical protein
VFTDQPSVVFDSKFQLPQAGSADVLQLNVLMLQAYAQVEPEQEPVALGLAGHFPLVLVQVLPAPSDIPHELAALQSGVLHWLRPDTQTCPAVHCELQSSEFLSAEQAVSEQAPQVAPTVPAIPVQPPHTLGVVPAHESELRSALQVHLRPHVPQVPSFAAPAGVSAPQPPHALGTAPVHISEFLSAEQVSLPQLPLPQAAFSVPVSAAQPPQAFFPGSLQAVLALSALHAYLPHCPHASPGALVSVPQPPQALALRPEHLTSVLSAVHSQFPQAPHEEFGALANTPQPPHAFFPRSLHVTDSLSAAHSYVPHSPHTVSGAATS